MLSLKTIFLSGHLIFVTSILFGAQGIAFIKPTSDQNQVSGVIELEDTEKGLKILATVENASAGNHGFHIHEFGSCADSGKAAGGHYNPKKAPHGHILKGNIAQAHAGDLGNITIGADGKGSVEAVIPNITLANSPNTVAGRSFIVHEKEDDFSQPVGNAGARQGCGVIIITAE